MVGDALSVHSIHMAGETLRADVPRRGVLEAASAVAAAIHAPAQDTSYTFAQEVCSSAVDVPRTARTANVLHYNLRVNTVSSLFRAGAFTCRKNGPEEEASASFSLTQNPAIAY